MFSLFQYVRCVIYEEVQFMNKKSGKVQGSANGNKTSLLSWLEMVQCLFS